MQNETTPNCPECAGETPDLGATSRRDFLRAASGLALASALPTLGRAAPDAKLPIAENKVVELYQSLSPDQKKVLCFPFDHPLRKKASANWEITKPHISELKPAQQDIVESVVKGLTSEEGFEKFMTQMAGDYDTFTNYHIALFGKPGEGDFEFVLTGRHVTMRADGNSVAGAAFGGPMVYGHAALSGNEAADHPQNVFWYQGKQANEVFKALDPKQRKLALVNKAIREDQIQHRPSGFQGLSVGEMSPDQKDLVKKVMHDLLNPYRKEDVDEVMQVITANGGLEKVHLAFYKNDENGKSADIGNDGVWDVWRLEGPGFVWHFRGAPHIHVWVNIAKV